jgi:hypothetical protein
MTEEKDQNKEQDGTRFDRLIVELLEHNEGVFLGENHRHPSLMQAATKLLPLFKAHGLRTLSWETPQAVVDDIKPDESYLDYENRETLVHVRRAAFELVQNAKRLGIKVIGHEHPKAAAVVEQLIAQQKIARKTKNFDPVYKSMQEMQAMATDPALVRMRDMWARDYIRGNRNGKVLIFGGEGHSGDYQKADAMRAPQSVIVNDDYQGLDRLLGYPSVDYVSGKTIGQVGAIVKRDKFSDYTVELPVDLLTTLRNLGINSWPPHVQGTNPLPSIHQLLPMEVEPKPPTRSPKGK